MRPLLVLRPKPGAEATAAAARARGLDVVAAPLFTIRPLAPDMVAIGAEFDALLLTSANAVRALGDRGERLHHLPVYAVGPATAAAARAAGFAAVVAGAGDAPAIVARAAADGHRRLLHPVGREHRAVEHPGIAVERVPCYAAESVGRLPPAAERALARGAVALLHSPRAARLFAALVDAAGLPRERTALAALSPAIAAAAGGGWRAVAPAARPEEAVLLAAAAKLCEDEPGEA